MASTAAPPSRGALRVAVGSVVLVSFGLVQCAQWSFVTSHRDSRGDHNCLRRWLRRRVAREAATADLDLDLMLTSPPGSGLSRYKGTGFDPEACGEACEALAEAIAKGNQQQVESLICALKLMMPPSSGAEQALGPPRDNFILRPEELDWSEQDFLGGLEENQRIVQECEAKFARLVAQHPEGFRAPEVLAKGLDLAVVYLKNYALDKADALYEITKPHCLSRGLPWNVKWFQDCATLRCKQNRQAEAAPMLEEVAKLTPPHEATLRNLGTVYNQLREHDKAKVYFDAAAELVGERDSNGKLILDKEDLWNIGLVHKNKKNYAEAAPMLDQALEKWLKEDPEDDVTLAKLYDSVGSCYDEMGRHEEAVEVLQKAKDLYDRSIGTESPLYGSACERLSRALVHAQRHQEGLDNLIEAFTVIALQDAVHPTPLFELLGIALEEIPITKEVDVRELARLEMPIQAAVRNMRYRGLDQVGRTMFFSFRWQLWSPLRAHGARAGALQLCRWHGRGAALGRAAPRDRADASAARTAASGASHQRGPGGFDAYLHAD
ncbi:unnamed protein product [Durusdinium trenchii]|uniref:Uncharacterized protein n=1 Tax=Durusdinium trenchii TaxID=1381693 RepID=A0ABP0P5U0_9DINO